MNQEYKYLLIIGLWLALWTFLPFVAFPLMIIMVVRHFMSIRRQRKAAPVPVRRDERRWRKMEGLDEDPADWWKRE